MGVGNINLSDLYGLHHITQNSMVSYSKEVFIEVLRNLFAQDSYFHYSKDDWGFANTPSQLGLDLQSGLHDDTTTRIYIGESWRTNIPYFPSLLVTLGGFQSKPISISRNEELVQYKAVEYIDGYNNRKIVSTPDYIKMAGAYEGSIVVNIWAGGDQERDELIDLVVSMINIVAFRPLMNAGIFVKPDSANVSGPSEQEDGNGKFFKSTITFSIRTEWQKIIPISNIIEIINFCVDIGIPSAPEMEIKQQLSISDVIDQLE